MRSYGTTNAAPYAVAPAVGLAGDTYFNTTEKVMYMSDGTVWISTKSVGTTPAFWFSGFSGPSQFPAGSIQATPDNPQNASGFHRHANGTTVVCDVAGWYRIGIHFTEQPGTALSQYTDIYISVRDGANFNTVLYQSNPVGYGLTTTVGYYFAADGELVAYMRVGDMVNIQVACDQMKIFHYARSYLSIIPLTSIGPQGIQGIPGSPGTALGFDGFIRRYTTAVDGSVSLPAGTLELPLGTVINAQGATFTPNGANSKFTVPANGIYTISAQVSSYSAGWPADQVILLLMVNGIAIAREYPKQGFAYQSVTMSVQWYLQAGDQIGLNLYTGVTTTFRAFPGGSTIDPPGPYLSVWKTGSGVKGDPGVDGMPGSATDVSGYWTGNCVIPTSLPASTVTKIPLAAPKAVSNFTLISGEARCDLAGRYLVVAMICTRDTVGTYMGLEIRQVRASVTIRGEQALAGMTTFWEQISSEGIFDLQVNDTISLWAGGDAARTMDFRNMVMIVPVGGAKGDPGPDITMQQSSFFYGINATNSGVLGSDVPTVMPWTQVQNNGFTLANANQRITCTQAGKYEVTASLGYYTGANAAIFSRAQIYHRNSGGTQIAWINGLGNGAPANTYCEAVVTGVFDMAVGDYIDVFAAIASSTGNWNSNNFVAVVPVGGTKGPIGPSGGPVPTGGTANQIIAKQSTTDFDVAWTPQPGRVAEVRYTGGPQSQGSGANYDITGASVTFTRRSDRRYRAHYGAVLQQLVAVGGHSLILADSANTNLDQTEAHSTTGYKQNHSRTAEVTGAAGSVTLKLRMITNGGNIQVINGASPSYIYIEDTGPYP